MNKSRHGEKEKFFKRKAFQTLKKQLQTVFAHELGSTQVSGYLLTMQCCLIGVGCLDGLLEAKGEAAGMH